MNTEVKNAMLEFLEPGSSIPLEKLLDAFAKMAIGTKRGCFYITKNVRTQKWRIQLTGIKKSFIGDDLRKLVIEAGEYVFTHTVQKEGEKVLQP